jgi:hypothetical protein
MPEKHLKEKMHLLMIGSNAMLARHFQKIYNDGFTSYGITRRNVIAKKVEVSLNVLPKYFCDHQISVLYFVSNFAERKNHYERKAYDKELKVSRIYCDFIKQNINLKKIIFMSSGGSLYSELDGKAANETSPVLLDDYYKRSKLAQEELFQKNFGIKSTSLRISNLFGSEFHKSSTIGFIDNLIKKGNPHFRKPERSVTKDWIHADEVCSAIEKILKIDANLPKIINLGSGISYDIMDIHKSYMDRDLSKLLPVPDGYRLGLDKLHSLGIYPKDRLKKFLMSKIQYAK